MTFCMCVSLKDKKLSDQQNLIFTQCYQYLDHVTLKVLVPIRSLMNLFNSEMGDHFGTAGTVSNPKPVHQTKQSLVNTFIIYQD